MIDTKTPTTFSFQAIPGGEPVFLRTTMIDGEPWFVGADVLKVLYGQAGGKASHYAALDPDEMCKVDRINLGLPPGRPMVLLAESGLYALINRSDKPEAKVFQRWVNREVLPSIRKTGGYLLNEAARETAFADKREAMPLPMDIAEALSKFSAAQEETNRLLQAA